MPQDATLHVPASSPPTEETGSAPAPALQTPQPVRIDATTEVEGPSESPGIEDDIEFHEVGRSRRGLKIVTAICSMFVVGAAGGAALLLGSAPKETQRVANLTLSIPDQPMRQRTSDGRDVVTTTALVVNDGTAPGRMPDLNARMRTADGRVVREWRVTPPAGDVPARGSRTIRIGTTGSDIPDGPLKLDIDMVAPIAR